jgi:hypothetical protein
MKIAALAAAATIAATSVSAMDLGSTGLSLNTEVDASWDLDADTNNILVTLEPELGYSIAGVSLTAGMDLDVYKNEEFVLGDQFDALSIDFGASYQIMEGLSAYGETTWDVEASELEASKVGVTFSF